MNNKVFRWIALGLVILLIVAALMKTARTSMGGDEPVVIEGYTKWDPELVKEFGSIAVQDGGRIKPFSTWAGFEMLTLNGKRSIRFEDGKGEKIKIGPTEWALDCMLRPKMANQMEFFQVENAQVLDMIEMGHDYKKRRDRYSFNELDPYLDKVDEVHRELLEKQAKQGGLEPVEDQFLAFASSIDSYASLKSHLSIVRTRLTDDTTEFSLFSTWIKTWSVMQPLLAQQMEGNEMGDKMKRTLADFTYRIERGGFSNIAMMPPAEAENKDWPIRRVWLRQYMSGEAAYDQNQIDYLIELEKMAQAYENGGEAAFLEAVKAYKEKIKPALEARGEGQSIGSEVMYYKMDYFYRAFLFCILGFLVVAFGWVAPGSKMAKVCNIIGWGALVVAIVITVAGITHRSILMQRPPVGNLYDTIPFIVAVALIVLAIIEVLTKRSVCLGLALFFGIVCLSLSMLYEEGKAQDHMDPLVAVLRSNYWLTIHVLTITMGYAGGLLTAGLSYVALLTRWLQLDEGDKKFRRLMARIVYGGICFTLFFSLVGTILGGVWANDSWGRFWGWDPKENGALIIVLWTLIILHARLGGYIREWGLHACSVICAALVAFSWWHVNFLGTGLHNYGFTGDDGLKAVYAFYAINGLFAVVAIICAIIESEQKKVKAILKGEETVPID